MELDAVKITKNTKNTSLKALNHTANFVAQGFFVYFSIHSDWEFFKPVHDEKLWGWSWGRWSTGLL